MLVYWEVLAMMTATAERTPCEERIYILPSNVATSLSPKYKELGHFTLLGNLSNDDGNAKDDGSKKMDLNFKL